MVIRVRPPNQRELALPGGVIVEVGQDEKQIIVTGKPPFSYDIALSLKVTQEECFEKVGLEIVQTAYNGYNSSMFAYGQTSSGKSFSMMGVRGTALVGLIPRIAHLLFYVITKTPERQFFVEGSFLEIYNEKLRDLLDKSGTDDLKVRESPQLGVHVAGLSRHTVTNVEAVEKVIEDGTGNRTVAATKYNSESSRSHAVFELHIQQKYKDGASGEEMQSKTKIALVDLAGSERSDKLGSVGKALQEGNNINKSLTVLGRCIKALVEKAKKPKKKINVPFRESVLTWYLRESLSGNARTTMLACCSPAASNEEETLSTLRYAASAKQIKTSAKKNEDPLKAKARELAQEVEKLKALLAAGDFDGGDDEDDEGVSLMSLLGGEQKEKVHGELQNMSASERAEYMKEIEAQMKLMGKEGFQIANQQAEDAAEDAADELSDKDRFPQLSCLNKDDVLSHAMVVPISDSQGNVPEHFGIGRSGVEDENDFELDGMGIGEAHCEIIHADGKATIKSGGVTANTTVNGVSVSHETASPLAHLDRIVFGPCRMLCLYLTKPLTAQERATWTYLQAFREFRAQGGASAQDLMSAERAALVDQLHEVDVQLDQANKIALEMCTTLHFRAMVQVGHLGLTDPDMSIDDLVKTNDRRVLVSCVAGKKLLKNVDQVGKLAEKKAELATGGLLGNTGSLKNVLEAEEALSDVDAKSGLKSHEALGNWKNRELFEISAEDFGDLLASLKASHSNLQSLTGGIADAGAGGGAEGGGGGVELPVRKIFDAIDMDGSGVIDREELAAAIIRFDRNHDPKFLDRVLEQENISEMEVDMTYQQFEEFLIRFLQHQCYECIESCESSRVCVCVCVCALFFIYFCFVLCCFVLFRPLANSLHATQLVLVKPPPVPQLHKDVTNHKLFKAQGGRPVTVMQSGEVIRDRGKSIGGMSDLSSDSEGGGGGKKSAKSTAAAKAKAETLRKKGMEQMLGLSIEEHKARANKRISEHARVQYFQSVLLTDLKMAQRDLDLLLQSSQKDTKGGVLGCFGGGSSAAKQKKAKTDRGIVAALSDIIQSSYRELQILQTSTSHSNKHRSELERMVEALLEKQHEGETALDSLPDSLGLGGKKGAAGGKKGAAGGKKSVTLGGIEEKNDEESSDDDSESESESESDAEEVHDENDLDT